MMAQEAIVFSEYFRCYVLGGNGAGHALRPAPARRWRDALNACWSAWSATR
jgi:hypothetical protein